MGSNLTGTWTDERVERLKVLWAAGASAREIAVDLGNVTRNSVCGKIDRLGLSGAPRSKKRAPVTRKRKSPAAPRAPENRSVFGVGAQVQAINRRKTATPEIVEEEFKPRLADVVSRKAPLLDLGAMECRWADEDRDEDGRHTFCGNPTEDGSSYCGPHAELARGNGTASERAVAPLPRREAA